MEQLSISLFDPLQVTFENERVTDFRTKKVIALLVCLAAEPETAHRREELMTLLWPGMPDTSARANLRQVLFRLRQIISVPAGEENDTPLLLANRHTIQLNPAGSLLVDTVRFETLLSQTQTHDHLDLLTCHKCREDLAAATALYTGHFLADFYLEDSSEFEEWAEVRRQRYLRMTLDALETLTSMAMRQQAYVEARAHAERQLDLDLLREGAYQQLMEILARSGQPTEALAVYEKCRRLLEEELGMAPASRTTQLYEQILAGDIRFDTEPDPGGVRGYELQEEIGAGGYGVIHRAVQPTIGREVAVKIIRRQYADDPAFIRRFEAEAQTIARLEHPHIVPLYDYWRDPEGAYLVMRLLRGGNLLAALAEGPWPLDRTEKLLDQISLALAAAHHQGIVHRDIKPANILFDESDNAFLSDFGIAKDLHDPNQLTAQSGILGTPDYLSPEQVQEGTVSPQSDIYSLGAVLYETLTGEKPFPDAPVITIIQNHLSEPLPLVRDSRPNLSPQIDDVIQKATAKQPAERFPDVLTFAEAFRQAAAGRLDITTSIELPTGQAEISNPYKGLRAFQEADAVDFFGRDALTTQLVEHLTESRFLAVIGPSGSGKSSVVKAGVIPALRQGAIRGSDKWFVAEMVPGAHPLQELEMALWPVAVEPPPSLVEPMRRDPGGILRTVRRILPEEENAQLLLVIDQFEELWSLTPDKQRHHFLDSLMAALSAPHSPLHVIVTLRADFYDRPLQYQPIAELFREHAEVVLPLSRDELTWAIQEPARRAGVGFADTVLPAIVAEVDEQPGALPLLQYALTELFAARSEGQITREAYEEIGGVLGALPRRADEIYANLSAFEKELARQLFLRLTTLGEGVEDTRRRVLLAELEGIQQENDTSNTGEGEANNSQSSTAAREIINRFGAARLLIFDHDPATRQPTVEVAHEALLREWGELRRWLDESRDDVRLQRLLAAAVREWQLTDRNQEFLLQGARLTQYELWSQETTVALTEDEQSFVAASINARRQREAAEDARVQRELETAQQLAETERQRAEEQVQAAHNLRRRAIYLGAALIVAAVLAVVAIFASLQATDNAETAVANANAAASAEAVAEAERAVAQENEALASAAEAEALAQAEIASFNESQAQSLALTTNARQALQTGNLDLALALAVEAVAVEQPPAVAVRTLSDIAFAPGTSHITENSAGPISSLEMNPHRSKLVAVSDDGTVTVWHSRTGELLNQFQADPDSVGIVSQAVMSDGKRLILGYKNGAVVIWDLATGAQLQTLEGLLSWVWEVVGSPDGTTVVGIADFDKFGTDNDEIKDGLRMIAWDIDSGEEIYRLETPGEWMTTAAISSNNKTALFGLSTYDEESWTVDGNIRLLIVDLTTGAILAEPVVEVEGDLLVGDLAIHPAGEQATALVHEVDENGEYVPRSSTGLLMSLPSGDVNTTVTFGEDTSPPLLYSPDGSQIVIGQNSHFLLFDADTGEKIRFLGSEDVGHGNQIDPDTVLFTPDGSSLFSGSQGSDLAWWDVATGERVQRLLGHQGAITGVEISPDGRGIISSSEDGSLRYWDLPLGGGAEIETTYQAFEGHQHRWIPDVAISPDGTRAVSTEWTDWETWGSDSVTREAIVWDTNTLEIIHRLPGDFFQVEFLPDGKSVLLGGVADQTPGMTGELLLVHWDVESGDEIGRTNTDITGDQLFNMDISWDGSSLLFATRFGHIYHYDVESLEQLGSFSHGSRITQVAISPDGRKALSGNEDGEIILWDLDTRAEIRRYKEGGLEVSDVAFTADGTRFVSTSFDQSVILWDVESGEVVRTFNGHSDQVYSVAFTPDESQIITSSGDGMLIQWDVVTGEVLRTYNEHNNADVQRVVVSTDGQWAYSAGWDGRVIGRSIGDLPIEDALEFIRNNRVLREFTCEEREQYRILPLCDAGGTVPGPGE